MAFDTHSLEAYSLVATAPTPASSGTSLVVTSGQGALFHTGQNCTVWPSGAQPLTTNSEIVRITNISTDTLTITRTQEGSSARSIIVGDQIANTITPKVLTDVESLGYINSTVYTGGDISSTATSGAPATLTALATTATVPAIARQVKITLSAATNNSSAIGAANYYGIWRGTVGSGTLVKGGYCTDIGSGDDNVFCIVGIDNPGAGSYTYNIGFFVTGGTGVTKASATEQVLVLIEAI